MASSASRWHCCAPVHHEMKTLAELLHGFWSVCRRQFDDEAGDTDGKFPHRGYYKSRNPLVIKTHAGSVVILTEDNSDFSQDTPHGRQITPLHWHCTIQTRGANLTGNCQALYFIQTFGRVPVLCISWQYHTWTFLAVPSSDSIISPVILPVPSPFPDVTRSIAASTSLSRSDTVALNFVFNIQYKFSCFALAVVQFLYILFPCFSYFTGSRCYFTIAVKLQFVVVSTRSLFIVYFFTLRYGSSACPRLSSITTSWHYSIHHFSLALSISLRSSLFYLL